MWRVVSAIVAMGAAPAALAQGENGGATCDCTCPAPSVGTGFPPPGPGSPTFMTTEEFLATVKVQALEAGVTPDQWSQIVEQTLEVAPAGAGADEAMLPPALLFDPAAAMDPGDEGAVAVETE